MAIFRVPVDFQPDSEMENYDIEAHPARVRKFCIVPGNFSGNLCRCVSDLKITLSLAYIMYIDLSSFGSNLDQKEN